MQQTATQEAGGAGAAKLDTDHLADLAREIMAGNTDLAAIVGMTEDELEAVYSLAHGFYTSGRYGDALDMFRFLCMHRHMDPRFWFGLGATNQMLGEHATAVTAYQTCAMLDLEDAQVPMRAAECFRAMGDAESARQALEAVVEVAKGKPAQAAYAKRAEAMLQQMRTAGAARP